ncbi:kinesin-6 [Naegleria gruberi]|uniref:Kinesin-6 n=1 Tax=Naegleria gruberi TaxID=5762 RepID=D2VDS8_NAEGR|nr:kinesin-6 [Naegleria gruberi]EFC45052.1 kinesin-6 [Naegleria gruberi]|eukprot:XP_002677796.1 kinesin-6 [Naegleria gruberi]
MSTQCIAKSPRGCSANFMVHNDSPSLSLSISNNSTTTTSNNNTSTTGGRKVRVASRIRPLLPSEVEKSGFQTCRVGKSEQQQQQSLNNIVYMKDPRNPGDEIRFEFDATYDESSTQDEIFQNEIIPIVDTLFDGFNTTVFCYGMTGSGKTHTMQGGETLENMGLIPRTVQQLLFEVERRKGPDSSAPLCKLSVSYLEIYNEKVFDLLVSSKDSTTSLGKDLPLHEDKSKNIIVKGLTIKSITSYDGFCEEFYQVGMKNRKVASTKLNVQSSRSHAILTLTVKNKDPRSGQWLTGKINLIDLAGSEDNRKTGNTGARLAESSSINTSLFSLRKVVDQLNSKNQKVSYRDSKLTRLLQDSLGGSSQAIMVVNVSPFTEHYVDTHKSLRFGMKSQSIVNKPVINASYFENEEERKALENMANIGYGADKDTQLKLLQLEKEKLMSQKKIGVTSTSKSLSGADYINQMMLLAPNNFATKEDLEKAQEDLKQGILNPILKRSISLQDEILDRLAKLEHLALTGASNTSSNTMVSSDGSDFMDMKRKLSAMLNDLDEITPSKSTSSTPSSAKSVGSTPLTSTKKSSSTPMSVKTMNSLPTPPLFQKQSTTTPKPTTSSFQAPKSSNKKDSRTPEIVMSKVISVSTTTTPLAKTFKATSSNRAPLSTLNTNTMNSTPSFANKQLGKENQVPSTPSNNTPSLAASKTTSLSKINTKSTLNLSAQRKVPSPQTLSDQKPKTNLSNQKPNHVNNKTPTRNQRLKSLQSRGITKPGSSTKSTLPELDLSAISPIKEKDITLFPVDDFHTILGGLENVTTDDLFEKKNNELSTSTAVQPIIITPSPLLEKITTETTLPKPVKIQPVQPLEGIIFDPKIEESIIYTKTNVPSPVKEKPKTRQATKKNTAPKRKRSSAEDSDSENEQEEQVEEEEKKNSFVPKAVRRGKKPKQEAGAVFFDNAALLEISTFAINKSMDLTLDSGRMLTKEDKLALARNHIKEAAILKKEGNERGSLELLEKALALLPTNEKLQRKVEKLKRRIKNEERTKALYKDEEEEKQVNNDKMVDEDEEEEKPKKKTATKSKPASLKSSSTAEKILEYINDESNEVKELKRLVTIGDKKAEKIIEHRPFKSINELTKIGIGEKSIPGFVEKNEKVIDDLVE